MPSHNCWGWGITVEPIPSASGPSEQLPWLLDLLCAAALLSARMATPLVLANSLPGASRRKSTAVDAVAAPFLRSSQEAGGGLFAHGLRAAGKAGGEQDGGGDDRAFALAFSQAAAGVEEGEEGSADRQDAHRLLRWLQAQYPPPAAVELGRKRAKRRASVRLDATLGALFAATLLHSTPRLVPDARALCAVLKEHQPGSDGGDDDDDGPDPEVLAQYPVHDMMVAVTTAWEVSQEY